MATRNAQNPFGVEGLLSAPQKKAPVSVSGPLVPAPQAASVAPEAGLLQRSSETRQPTGVYSGAQGQGDLVSRALAGPENIENWATITGVMGGDQRFLQSTTTKPTVTYEDILAGMEADRRQQEQAQAQDVARYQGSFDLAREGLLSSYDTLKEEANQHANEMGAMLDQETAGAAARTDEIRDRARDLPESAAGREQELSAEARGLKAHAMGQYTDTFASAMETQRKAVSAQVDQRLDSIASEFAQRGFDPSDPQVQAAMDREMQQAAQSVGSIASQLHTQYAQGRASLLQTYDQSVLSAKAASNARVQAAETSSVQGLLEAAKLDESLTQLRIQERASAEQNRLQAQTLADQFYYQGAYHLADMMRAEPSYVSPITPLVAAAFGFQQAQSSQGVTGAKTNATLPSWTSGGQTGTLNTYTPFSPASGGSNQNWVDWGNALKMQEPGYTGVPDAGDVSYLRGLREATP